MIFNGICLESISHFEILKNCGAGFVIYFLIFIPLEKL